MLRQAPFFGPVVRFNRVLSRLIGAVGAVALVSGAAAGGVAPFFSTGNPDGKFAAATRPSSSGKIEIEAADDFLLNDATKVTQATFTGIVTGTVAPGTIVGVAAEFYRVFPKDSNDPPSGNVPTRTNSPSDNAFKDLAGGVDFTIGTTLLTPSFTASNSVLNGIHKSPNQTTGGEGAVTGQEYLFSLTFLTPVMLPADHYFFVPQVEVSGGEFYWLSAPKPIVAPGTPFSPDLQSWIRNSDLDPDWLRMGTDIVGGQTPPTYNMAFSLTGTVPAPSGGVAGLVAGAVMGLRRRRA